MKVFIKHSTRRLHSKCGAILLLSIMLSVVFSSCKKSPESISLVEFSGIEEIANYSKMPFVSNSAITDTAGFVTIPVSNYDIITNEEDVIVIYDNQLMNSPVEITEHEGIVKVNGKVYSIFIPKDESMLQWFKTMKEMDLSALSILYLDSDFNEIYVPYLIELSRMKPDIGFSAETADMKELLEYFNPRYLVGPMKIDDIEWLSEQTNLEVIYTAGFDSEFQKPLPPLPNLKHICFVGGSFSESVSENFFANNPQLEKLTYVLGDDEEINFSVLKPLLHLKELVIFGENSLKNTQILDDLKNLEVLSIKAYEGDMDFRTLNLPKLKWLTFGPDDTQGEFDDCINKFSGLNYIEFYGCDSIANLDALIGLEKLEGLIINEMELDVASLSAKAFAWDRDGCYCFSPL